MKKFILSAAALIYLSGCCGLRFGAGFWIPKVMHPPIEYRQEIQPEPLPLPTLPAPQIKESKEHRKAAPRINFDEGSIA